MTLKLVILLISLQVNLERHTRNLTSIVQKHYINASVLTNIRLTSKPNIVYAATRSISALNGAILGLITSNGLTSTAGRIQRGVIVVNVLGLISINLVVGCHRILLSIVSNHATSVGVRTRKMLIAGRNQICTGKNSQTLIGQQSILEVEGQGLIALIGEQTSITAATSYIGDLSGNLKSRSLDSIKDKYRLAGTESLRTESEHRLSLEIDVNGFTNCPFHIAIFLLLKDFAF